jgi:hypothetical protein
MVEIPRTTTHNTPPCMHYNPLARQAMHSTSSTVMLVHHMTLAASPKLKTEIVFRCDQLVNIFDTTAVETIISFDFIAATIKFPV